MNNHEVRMRLLEWVQQHTILRRDDNTLRVIPSDIIDGNIEWKFTAELVSDYEAVEELLDAIKGTTT